MVEKIASDTLKLIPDNQVIGGGGGGAGGDAGELMNGFFGISLIEKLTGRSFTVKDAEKPAELAPVKKVWFKSPASDDGWGCRGMRTLSPAIATLIPLGRGRGCAQFQITAAVPRIHFVSRQ